MPGEFSRAAQRGMMIISCIKVTLNVTCPHNHPIVTTVCDSFTIEDDTLTATVPLSEHVYSNPHFSRGDWLYCPECKEFYCIGEDNDE